MTVPARCFPQTSLNYNQIYERMGGIVSQDLTPVREFDDTSLIEATESYATSSSSRKDVNALRIEEEPRGEETKLADPGIDDSSSSTLSVGIVLGSHGTEVTTLLGPLEILLRSGMVKVSLISPRKLAPLTGNVGVLVDCVLGFQDNVAFSQHFDYLILPSLSDPTETEVLNFLSGALTRNSECRIVTICEGARVFLELLKMAPNGTFLQAGMMTKATSSETAIPSLISQSQSLSKPNGNHPPVDFIYGHRYIVDGRLLSSAGIVAGIDLAGHILREEGIVGTDDVTLDADLYQEPDFHGKKESKTASTDLSLSFAASAGLYNRCWNPFITRYNIGVLLTDNISEIGLAACLDSWPRAGFTIIHPFHFTWNEDTNTVSKTSGMIQTKHGMNIVCDSLDLSLDRLHFLVLPMGTDRSTRSFHLLMEMIDKQSKRMLILDHSEDKQSEAFHKQIESIGECFGNDVAETVHKTMDMRKQ